MAKITFIDAGGTERGVDAKLGSTVMEVAIRNAVPGIEARMRRRLLLRDMPCLCR